MGGLSRTIRRRLLGLLFLAVLAGLVSLSIAAYNKAFTPVVLVKLKTDHSGNQLLPESTVAIRGVPVGEVRSISSTGDGAVITLAIEPKYADRVENYYTAQLLPKTLFGELYVALQPTAPREPAYCANDQPPGPIRAGQTLCQDRSKSYAQLSQVFSDITPLLQALKPAELKATLDALATALAGRGAQLGTDLTQLDQYLKRLNPHVPQLVDDLDKLGQVAQEYRDVSPDLFATLANLQTTARTVEQKQAALSQLLSIGTQTSGTLSDFLQANAANLITVTSTSKQIFALLAEYAPEYDCLLAGLAAQEPVLENAFRDDRLHITLEVVKSRGKYVPGNEPKTVTGVGPNCYGIPSPAIPFQPPPIDDGAPLVGGPGTGALDASYGPGSAAETKLVNTLISGEYGTTPDKVPAVASILAAPILRGTAVTAK